MATGEALDQIVELEQKLLATPWRNSPTFLQNVLADDFCEIGKSGKIWDKTLIIADLLKEADSSEIEATAFNVTRITEDIALIRYRTRTAGGNWVERSSLWKKLEKNWQLVFHQGTPVQRENFPE